MHKLDHTLGDTYSLQHSPEKTRARAAGRVLRTVTFLVSAGALAAVHWPWVDEEPTGSHAMIARSFGSHYQFLTVLGLTLTFLATASSLLSVLPRGVKHTLFATALAFECGITILYYLVGTVLGKEALMHGRDIRIPLLLDLAFHFFPTVLLVCDFFLLSEDYERRMSHSLVIALLAEAYHVWVHVCFAKNGFWPYPFLESLFTETQRHAFFIICSALTVGILEGLYLLRKRFQMRREIAVKKMA